MTFSSLERLIRAFLKNYWNGSSKLLIAFSGGPDSLALLHLLLDDFKKESLDPRLYLALAHVDHGWRAESGEERQQIHQMALEEGLQLHVKILENLSCSGNLEEVCRLERLRFFSKLCFENNYQAVFLAQHADDQAETVLKRILEGAALSNLGGMSEATIIDDLVVWRPLLKVRKKELLQWLEARGLEGFDDYTNRDPRFLRAKLRLKILPELSKAFGKEVSGSLLHLGAEALELQNYLKGKMEPLLSQTQEGEFGFWLDLSQQKDLSVIEAKFLVRECCGRANVFLSRDNINRAAELLIGKQANKFLSAGADKNVYIDRGHLFILPFKIASLSNQKVPLKPGTFRFGDWTGRVTVLEKVEEVSCQPSSWRDLWKGKGEVLLPMGEYCLGGPETLAFFDKQWTAAKVPAFLRAHVPVICSEKTEIHEFLSGRYRNPFGQKESLRMKIELWMG